MVVSEHVDIFLPQPVQQQRRALDVGEEKCDGAGREVG
jgi:hypothetical protein